MEFLCPREYLGILSWLKIYAGKPLENNGKQFHFCVSKKNTFSHSNELADNYIFILQNTDILDVIRCVIFGC